jgi:hypothetical protein
MGNPAGDMNGGGNGSNRVMNGGEIDPMADVGTGFYMATLIGSKSSQLGLQPLRIRFGATLSSRGASGANCLSLALGARTPRESRLERSVEVFMRRPWREVSIRDPSESYSWLLP